MTDLMTVSPEFLGEAVRCLQVALDRVNNACRALDEYAAKLETNEARPGDLAAALTTATKAALQAQEQKGKIENVLRIERGGDGLDLDAARVEIRCRLDRILAAGDA
ncbi:MAG: hypothetical protein AAF366_12755 [Pseudomonadota bacterium]